MAIAAMIVSVVSVVAAAGACWYADRARRRAQAAAAQIKILREAGYAPPGGYDSIIQVSVRTQDGYQAADLMKDAGAGGEL